MNKKILILLIIFTMFIITACSKEVVDKSKDDALAPSEQEVVVAPDESNDPLNERSYEKNDGEVNTDTDDEENVPLDVIEQEDGQPTITHENNPNFAAALEGKVDGIEFGIGASTKTILESWGLPDLYDYYTGALFFRYDDRGVIFFTGASLAQDGETMVHDEVKEIVVFSEEQSVYNVNVGMTLAEIIKVLGDPSYRYSPEDAYLDELLMDNWIIMYDVGNFIVIFASSEEDGPTHALYLRSKV